MFSIPIPENVRYLSGMTKKIYHMFANGDDAKSFITSESEFKAAFNRFAVCAYVTGVDVLSFSVEDTHPHALLRGSFEDCTNFKNIYEQSSLRSIARRRGSLEGVKLHCELSEVSDEQYLMNVGTYTIVQATKDGKAVMPYDYRYGTGALYFRSKYSVLPWLIDDEGNLSKPVLFGSLREPAKRAICPSRTDIPDDWLVCNGFILPTNYVDVQGFERIYKTHNCFRVFLCGSKQRDTEIINRMSEVRGVMVEDLEARTICKEFCRSLFKKESTRFLDTGQRLELARSLRQNYHLAFRQLAFLTHIPEQEIRKYVK